LDHLSKAAPKTKLKIPAENSSNISRDCLEFIFELPYQGCGKTCFETHCSQQVQGAPEKPQKVNAQILKQHFQSRGGRGI